MDTSTMEAFGERVEALLAQAKGGVQTHPVFFVVALVFLLLTWSHFRGGYGPQTWALPKERHRFWRATVHLLVLPLRLLAALFSSAVALLVIALLAGFAYALWRMLG
jgi:hypothetical protein